MDKLTQMQTLLPCLADLPRSETTEAFWKAAETGSTYAAFCALLALLAGEERHKAYGVVCALTGKGLRDVLRQPFPAICRALMESLDQETLLFCCMASACGVRAVARVLYQYRPPCAMAIPELLLMDRDNLKISMYACDMLRAIVCMFSKANIPALADVLDPTGAAGKQADENQRALQAARDLLNMFSKEASE